MHQFDLIVIGGGPAGVTAALRARELGASVALVERDRMGGTCTNDGCAPTRVLAKAARLLRDAEQLADYGISGDRPALDLATLLGRTQSTVYRLHEKKQLLEHLDDAGVTVWSEVGPAHFLDANRLAVAGQALAAERFILCAGGHARRLDFPGSELALTHSDVWTLKRVPASVAIVGGAATGCQLASIFDTFGAAVTVLDVAGVILGGEDETVSRAMAEAFTRRRVRVITGIDGVDKVERRPGGLRLYYRHEGMEQSLVAATIILAVGWVGNVESLDLPAAGVDVERGYVVTDETLQTSAPHIYAAGDINGRMMLVQSAMHEARVAVENALLGTKRPFHHAIVPHGGFTDPEYGSVGLTEAQARARGDCAVAIVPYADLDRAVIDGRTEGFCKLIVDTNNGQILGAHVVGEQAVEVVQIAAAGMMAGMTVEQLAELDLAYPTFTAVMGLAARQLVRELALTPLAPAWQALSRLGPRSAEWERADSGNASPLR